MILDWIDHLGLVKARDFKNVLREFPLPVKRVIVTEMVKYVSKKYEEACQLLKTPTHVLFMMEIIGQSFQLPIEDAEVIHLTIDIYHKWFFNKTRPEPIERDPQPFFREMLRHVTFLFTIREGQPDKLLKEHILLCNRVLDIFLQLGMHGDIMDEETWNHSLLVILGIADYTLRGKKGITDLNYPVLKVLYELWLCSLSYDKVMWGHLQTYAVQWSKHTATIKQWDSVCFALTQKVVNLIYGPTEGTQNVKVKWEGVKDCPNQNVSNEVTELDLPDEYVYFVWYLMIHMIGNPNKILDPEIHLKAFQALQRMSKCFCTIGREPVPEPIKKKEGADWLRLPYAPDGNSILELFAAWYFEAVNRKVNVFNEGRAVAYASLCKIYCRKGGKVFTTQYLDLFYNALLNGLREEEDLVIVSSIMLNSSKIYSYELEGSHILIPKYVETCEKILRVPKGKPNPYQTNLRSACITMISSLICIPNRYLGGENCDPMYADLKSQIADLLEKALLCEKAPKNITHILWCISVAVYEDKHLEDQKIQASYITSMLDLLKTYGHQLKEITHDVFVNLFDVLSALTPLYRNLQKGNEKIGSFIIDELTNYISDGLRALPNEKQLSVLISECIYCMVDWLMVAHDYIMTNNFLVVNMLSRIEGCLNLAKHNFPNHDIDEIKKAASYFLAHLFNFVGNFPPTSDISAQSSALIYEDESILDDETLENSNYVRFFMFDDQYLFSVIEQPNDKVGGPGVTIIVRDITGKFVWDCRQLFGPLEKEEPKLGKWTGASGKDLTDHTPEYETNKVIMEFAPERKIKQKDDIDKYIALIDTQDENENGFYEDIAPSIQQVDISLKPMQMKSKYDSSCKFQAGRLLLAQLGYLSFGTTDKKRFYQLQNNNKLILNLKALDGCSERECHKFGVIYVKEGVDNQKEIFENNATSQRFDAFVDSLGWKVPLGKHTGFSGGLDKISLSTGEQTPYFADYKSEIIYHVPSLMPTSKTDPQQIHKKRHIGNDHVKIIWSEHTREWYKETITSHFNLFQIVLYPLNNGLLRVEILKKEDNIDCGPLYDGMIVGEHIVGTLARLTAISANRIVRKSTTGYQRPHAKRQALISDVATRYKTELPVNSYYSTLFFQKSDNIKQVEAKNSYKPAKKK